MSSRIIHVVPQLPPNVSGVGDYAVILGRRVVEQTNGDVQSAFVQAGYGGGDAPNNALTSVDLKGQSSESALVEAVGTLAQRAERAAVLVHFVGYGYQRRGCPLWLVRALRRLEDERPRLRRLTMFHELYATSRKPWTSAFWTAPVQRHIATRIAYLSDGLLTNREASATWLRRHAGVAPVRVSPTFSNVGEPVDLPTYDEREPYAVVFGAASRRRGLYEQHGEALNRMLRHLSIDRVVDIGSSIRDGATDALRLPVEATGVLQAEEVSAHLRRASVGVLRYSLAHITKSGIMAAYMAHGVLPLLSCERTSTPPLREGEHYLGLDVHCGTNRSVETPEARAEIACRSNAFYRETMHSRCAAQEIRGLFR